MPKSIPAWILLLLALPPHNSQAEKASLTPFTAHYALTRAGIEIAQVRRSLSKIGEDTYLYESDTNPTGIMSLVRKDRIVERSRFQLREAHVAPLQYSYVHRGSKKDRDIHLKFQRESGQIDGTVKGKPWRAALPQGVLDRFLVQLALMLDLQSGKRPLHYTVADGKRIKPYEMLELGREQVETPLGSFETVKIRDTGEKNRNTTLWCAPALDYLPVRVEHTEKGARYRMEIHTLNRSSEIR